VEPEEAGGFHTFRQRPSWRTLLTVRRTRVRAEARKAYRTGRAEETRSEGRGGGGSGGATFVYTREVW
jgi:hypothetical protein